VVLQPTDSELYIVLLMGKPIRFFLLAHPDDEILALPLLFDSRFKSVLFFVTAGKFDARYNEAQKATSYLREIGLEIDLFSNHNPCIDGQVDSEYSGARFKDLLALVSQISPNEIVTSFYEGGHQDHDSVAVLGFLLANKLEIPLLTFSTYCKSNNLIIPFRVMSPLENPLIFRFNRFNVAFASVSLFKIYRSQWKTWIGLSIFVLFRYLVGATSSFKYITAGLDLDLPETFYESRKRANSFLVKSNHRQLIDEVVGRKYFTNE
jgi:hypothetical protein